MNILVTGGLGHVGSHLIRRLSSKFNITVVDNLLTQRYNSLYNLDNPIKFKEKCISDITFDDLVDIDLVIHLAAITNASTSFKNKKQIEDINLNITNDFIDRCESAGCKFVFPSSASVYGTAADVVYEDVDSFLNPQSPYASTKLDIENRLKSYTNDYLILRFGTIFGTSIGMQFHTAINKFCYETATGNPLTVWAENYDHYRPYLGINDAVNSILFFLNNESWNSTYNVLTKNYKLSEIINYIKQKNEILINMVDTPLLNQFSYKVSNKKIKSLGFETKDNLYESIDNTLKMLKNLNG
jgi:nucleoside-diphosphate-sugar epimerase